MPTLAKYVMCVGVGAGAWVVGCPGEFERAGCNHLLSLNEMGFGMGAVVSHRLASPKCSGQCWPWVVQPTGRESSIG